MLLLCHPSIFQWLSAVTVGWVTDVHSTEERVLIAGYGLFQGHRPRVQGPGTQTWYCLSVELYKCIVPVLMLLPPWNPKPGLQTAPGSGYGNEDLRVLSNCHLIPDRWKIQKLKGRILQNFSVMHMCTNHGPIVNYFRKPDRYKVNRQMEQDRPRMPNRWLEWREWDLAGNVCPVKVRWIINIAQASAERCVGELYLRGWNLGRGICLWTWTGVQTFC